MSIRFSEIEAPAPEFDSLKEQYSEIEQNLESDELPTIIAAIDRWDSVRRKVATWKSLTELHFHQDTRDELAKQAREHCDEMSPKITELDVRVKTSLVNSPQRDQLAREFGEHCFALWESDITSYDPVIEADTVAESKLQAEYSELLASAKLEFRGEVYNHEGIDKFKFDGDRQTRYEALQVKWNWFAANVERLDDLYDQLVKLRDQMAKKLGLQDYIELGYRRMTRVDYNQQDVQQYREGIRKHVVPVCEQLCQRQADNLSIDQVMFWDEAVHRPEGNPVPGGDHDWMVAQAQTMFDQIGYGIEDFYRLMANDGYLDLKNRKGKAGGGFCTDLSTAGMPFVFANFNGTIGDVQVFTHEIGHAFQVYSSFSKRLYDYYWPTAEACEIHSMGLEFLTFPQMELFFGDDAGTFREDHLIGSLMFLPYGVAVDHYQHLVYESPGASPAERHAMWQEVERLYLPWCDYGDLPHLKDGGRWQLKQHIYLCPFYYIDYTLALACALQFWMRDRQDHTAAMEDYVALCKRGGEAAFLELVKSAKLVSPFDPDALETVMKEVKHELKLA